ncbi:hypothetical protein [uncultured Deefgea sp.]|uniref:hypothetical protein n=1 Tax=uncultured Deefgea sp. TaxID=1304914 RepID=UPI002604F6F7|nr:hypothetical protein [uncultured Deefgea sp.]
MKFLNQAKRFGAVVALGALATPAFAAGGIGDIFAAVDLTTVAAFVIATGVLIVGVAMAFKGIDLSKRAVRKA